MNYHNEQSFDNISIYSPIEGLTKGTMFQTLYQPYKNYTARSLMPKTEKSKLLIEVQAYDSAKHDMTLYLDVFPEDENALKLRKDFHKSYLEAKKLYESKFPALCPNAITKIPWNWATTKWPWEGEE